MIILCPRCNKFTMEPCSPLVQGKHYFNICANCGLAIAISQKKYYEFKCGITPDWTDEDLAKCTKYDKLVKEGKMTYRTVDLNEQEVRIAEKLIKKDKMKIKDYVIREQILIGQEVRVKRNSADQDICSICYNIINQYNRFECVCTNKHTWGYVDCDTWRRREDKK